jgi:hypothetical protein
VLLLLKAQTAVVRDATVKIITFVDEVVSSAHVREPRERTGRYFPECRIGRGWKLSPEPATTRSCETRPRSRGSLLIHLRSFFH